MSDKLICRAINSLYHYLSDGKGFDLSDIYVVTRNAKASVIVYHANVRPVSQVKEYVKLIDENITSLKQIKAYFVNDLNAHTTRTQLVVLNDSATHRKFCFNTSGVLSKTLQGIGHISYIDLSHFNRSRRGNALLFKDPCTKQKVYANLK